MQDEARKMLHGLVGCKTPPGDARVRFKTLNSTTSLASAVSDDHRSSSEKHTAAASYISCSNKRSDLLHNFRRENEPTDWKLPRAGGLLACLSVREPLYLYSQVGQPAQPVNAMVVGKKIEKNRKDLDCRVDRQNDIRHDKKNILSHRGKGGCPSSAPSTVAIFPLP